MTKEEVVERILDPGVIAIVRAKDSTSLDHVAEALYSGGVRAIEATMTTPGALDSLRALSPEVRRKMAIGVGTVLDSDSATQAIAAGAMFVVTPVLLPEVVRTCRDAGVPVVCGAFTPSEAFAAHKSGADFVKLFPADAAGPSYIRALLAPLPMLRIIPTGGVTPETAAAFLQAGCVALGAGSCLVSNEILRTGDMEALTERAREFVAAAKSARLG